MRTNEINKINNQYNFMNQTSLLILIYNVLMLYHQYIPNLIIFFINILFSLYIISVLNERFSVEIISLILLTLFIPTSFISITGSSYAVLPISWFTLTLFTLFIYTLKNGSINKINLFFLLSFIIFILISFFSTKNIFDSLKQFLTIITLYYSVLLIIDSLKAHVTKYELKVVNYYYILIAFTFSLIVLIQRFHIKNTGTLIGHYTLVGGREIYAGLMNDYSFASLFIASGAILVLVVFFEQNNIKLHQFIILEVTLLLSIVTVNARTGLFAFLVISLIYIVGKSMKMNFKALIFLGLSFVLIPKVLTLVTNSRGNQSILDSSGRVDNYVEALNVFTNNFFSGVGLGLVNLKSITGLNVPHNFFVQYLLQIGFFGTIIILIPFLIVLFKNLNNENHARWMLYTVMIGAMFIPDIISSRYLTVIIIIFSISNPPTERNLL